VESEFPMVNRIGDGKSLTVTRSRYGKDEEACQGIVVGGEWPGGIPHGDPWWR
jgi:hypothetical protein